MELRDIDNRLAEIRALDLGAMDDQAEVEKLTAEVSELNEQRAALIEQRKAEEAAVIASTVEPTETHENREAKPMENTITRNSPEYVNAYAEYIKTGDDKEVRSLLTENVSGTVAIPEVVENYVRAAWERNDIWNRIPKSYLKGNYKVQYEISGELAIPHVEGTDPITEENLVLGIVELKPLYAKKFVKISDEALSLTGESFLQYIYDEITNKILAAIVNGLLGEISSSAQQGYTGGPTSGVVQGALAASDIIMAEGQLTGDISDVVVMISRSAYAQYRSLQATNGNFLDVFDGLPILFTDQLPQGVRAIVGSLRDGAHANLPNGPAVEFKIDDRSLALTSQDMVAVLGRLYVGFGIVRQGSFCVIADA